MLVDDFPVRHLPDDEVQGVAFGWRRKLNQSFLSNCLDIEALFHAVGEAVGWSIKVEGRPDSSMGRANAFVSADRSKVFVRLSLIDAAANGDPEAVFDATHELAHVILHRATMPLARMADRNNHHKFLQPEESAEHQANVFARAFLMTDDEVARYPTPEALSESCFTPPKQAALRLAEYGRIRSRRERKPFPGRPLSDSVVEAKLKGYEGMACTDCLNFTLVRSGMCLMCDTCGATSGCS